MAGNGVAVIVVHGVADQKPGETAQALVDLMVAAHPPGGAGATYVSTSRTDLVLTVPPLSPSSAYGSRSDATPRSEDRDLRKSLRQSMRSDLQTRAADAPRAGHGDAVEAADRGIATTDYLLAKHRDNGAADEAYETSCRQVVRAGPGWQHDAITVYEMYWADLSRLSGALPRIVTELFTLVFRLSKLGRDTVDEACRWRLPPAVRTPPVGSPPGLAPPPRRLAWAVTRRLQTWLDWLFANGLAVLFAQLLLLAIGFVAFAGAALVADRSLLHVGLAFVVAETAMLVFAYRHRDSLARPALWAPPALVATACFGAIVVPGLRPWVSAALLLAVVTFVYDIGLRVADDRFPFVRTVGRLTWAALVALMLASAVHEAIKSEPGLDPEVFDVGWHAALFGVEVVLWVIKGFWVVLAVLLVAWLGFGFYAGREPGYEAGASIATGRLGLALSLATFLTLAMAIWALLSTVIDLASKNVAYTPCIFPFDEGQAQRRHDLRAIAAAGDKTVAPDRREASAWALVAGPAAPGSAASSPPWVAFAFAAVSPGASKPAAAVLPLPPNICLWPSATAASAAAATATAVSAPAPAPSASSARLFLDDRYRRSTTGFALVAAVLLILVMYLVAMFAPSVLAEMKLLVGRGRDQAKRAVDKGKAAPSRKAEQVELAWLDAAERDRIRRLGRWLTAGFRRIDDVVLAITGIGALLGAAVGFVFFFDVRLSWLEQNVGDVSELFLGPLELLVFTSAGIGVALTVLGGVLSKYLPALRAPLDIALDVDNHFREFPRAAIPRARIFSRYAALLRHVRAQGHDRIVIVAHSQGTVISAELLRYLRSVGNSGPIQEQKPHLDDTPLPPISLLTLGCPLRQLYAARFPTLYRWVLAKDKVQGVTGPKARDIGVDRWVNAFCSGDYVGRWLWSDSPDPDDPVGHPMHDSGPSDRLTAYDGFGPPPPMVRPFQTERESEVCLGFGAHTHYFEADQTGVARLVDSLVAP